MAKRISEKVRELRSEESLIAADKIWNDRDTTVSDLSMRRGNEDLEAETAFLMERYRVQPGDPRQFYPATG